MDRPDAGLAERFEAALLDADRSGAAALLGELPDASPAEALELVVVPALQRLGERWEAGDLALSQIYLAGLICEELSDRLLPGPGGGDDGPVLAGVAALEDQHVLGKRLVLGALRSSGVEVADLGQGLGPEALADRAMDRGVRVLLVSVLMLRSALRVKELVARLRARGSPMAVVVGGAPFRLDRELWREVGADAMGLHAAEAVRLVNAFSGEVHP